MLKNDTQKARPVKKKVRKQAAKKHSYIFEQLSIDNDDKTISIDQSELNKVMEEDQRKRMEEI